MVDNWVAQWGAGEDGDAGFAPRPLPDGVVAPLADYTSDWDDAANSSAGLAIDGAELAVQRALDAINSVEQPVVGFRTLPTADFESFTFGWPVASDLEVVWPLHCYATVGVARDLAPDTGTGAELYAVIGHAPRQLDRNIAVIGRVISGIEHLSTLPRGTGEAGVYEDRAEDTPIVSVRLGSELPEPPYFEYLSTDSASFARYVGSRANRHDAFYTAPAGGVDICNVQVPIRPMAE